MFIAITQPSHNITINYNLKIKKNPSYKTQKKMSQKQQSNTNNSLTKQQSWQQNGPPTPNTNKNINNLISSSICSNNNENVTVIEIDITTNIKENRKSNGNGNWLIWRKLRMIKECQGCRFCRKATIYGLLRSKSQNYGEIWRDWVTVRTAHLITNPKKQWEENFNTSQQTNNDNQQQQNDNFTNKPKQQLTKYYTNPQISHKLHQLTTYYKYYQYIPMSPVPIIAQLINEEISPFKIISNYFNIQTELIYLKIRQQLITSNGQCYGESYGEGRSQKDSLEMMVYHNYMRESKYTDKSEDQYERSFNSVYELLGEMRDNTSRNVSIVGCENSLVEKSIINMKSPFGKVQQSKKTKPGQKRNVTPIKSKSKLPNKSKSKHKNNPNSIKLLTVPVTIVDKNIRHIKKKKNNNSCGNLAISNTAGQKLQKMENNWSYSKKIESARVSHSGKKKPSSTTLNLDLKKYLFDLKKKINMDKQQFRNSSEYHHHKNQPQSMEKYIQLSCLNGTTSKFYQSQQDPKPTPTPTPLPRSKAKKKRLTKNRSVEEINTKDTAIKTGNQILEKNMCGRRREKGRVREFWTCSNQETEKYVEKIQVKTKNNVVGAVKIDKKDKQIGKKIKTKQQVEIKPNKNRIGKAKKQKNIYSSITTQF